MIFYVNQNINCIFVHNYLLKYSQNNFNKIIMKNHSRTSMAGMFKFLFIVPMALSALLSLNAQTVTSPAKNDSTNDLMSPQTIKSPTSSSQQADTKKVYAVIEKMPEFPGGEKALLDYISHKLRYPVEAQQKGIQGRIVIRFVVNKVGKVERAEVIRGLDPSIDKEGLRVVSSLPDFIPGEQKGEKVSVWYTIPITFKLPSNPEQPTIDPKKMPVIVLDGKILTAGNNISSINKDNIQSVNVLQADTEAKKAELIAKYGEQAVNGVILITSKK